MTKTEQALDYVQEVLDNLYIFTRPSVFRKTESALATLREAVTDYEKMAQVADEQCEAAMREAEKVKAENDALITEVSHLQHDLFYAEAELATRKEIMADDFLEITRLRAALACREEKK